LQNQADVIYASFIAALSTYLKRFKLLPHYIFIFPVTNSES